MIDRVDFVFALQALEQPGLEDVSNMCGAAFRFKGFVNRVDVNGNDVRRPFHCKPIDEPVPHLTVRSSDQGGRSADVISHNPGLSCNECSMAWEEVNMPTRRGWNSAGHVNLQTHVMKHRTIGE
jgi:hypothetical protein